MKTEIEIKELDFKWDLGVALCTYQLEGISRKIGVPTDYTVTELYDKIRKDLKE